MCVNPFSLDLHQEFKYSGKGTRSMAVSFHQRRTSGSADNFFLWQTDFWEAGQMESQVIEAHEWCGGVVCSVPSFSDNRAWDDSGNPVSQHSFSGYSQFQRVIQSSIALRSTSAP